MVTRFEEALGLLGAAHFFLRGVCLLGLGRHREAITAFDAAAAGASVGKRPFPVMYNRGLACALSGDWAKAHPDLERAAQLDPLGTALCRSVPLPADLLLPAADADGCFAYGASLIVRGNAEGARAAFLAAVESDPSRADAEELFLLIADGCGAQELSNAARISAGVTVSCWQRSPSCKRSSAHSWRLAFASRWCDGRRLLHSLLMTLARRPP